MVLETAAIYAFIAANPELIGTLAYIAVYAAIYLAILAIEHGVPQAIVKRIYSGVKTIVNAMIWAITLPFRAAYGLFNALFGKKVEVPAGFEHYPQENFDLENPPAPVYEQDLDIELPPGAAPRAGEVSKFPLPPEAYTSPPEDNADLPPPYTEQNDGAYELPEYEEVAEQRPSVVFAQ